jgi:hypothetical protein
MRIPSFLTIGSIALRAAAVPAPLGVSMSVDQSLLTHWCWAAVAVGVAAVFGSHSEGQCDVATRVINQGIDCCPGNPACNGDQLLSSALDGHYGGLENASVMFVKSELAQGRPVPVFMSSGGDDGHYVVIAAYDTDQDGHDRFGVWDPNFKQTVTWPWRVDDFLQNYDSGRSWGYSYQTK